jgi:mRNA interferase HigB
MCQLRQILNFQVAHASDSNAWGFSELKQVYPSADLVGRRTVFNIAGNKFRLIARMNYQSKRVFVLYILTHAEYDRGAWKQ